MPAKLQRAARISQLQEESHSLYSHVKDYLQSRVTYDQGILTQAFEEYDNPALAILLSGNRDKKSLEYKRTLRAIQTWKKKGSTPSAKYRTKLIQTLIREDTLPSSTLQKVAQQAGTVSLRITGYVQISNSPPELRTLKATLSAEEMQAFTTAILEEDQQRALDIVAENYRYPQFSLYGDASHTSSVTFS